MKRLQILVVIAVALVGAVLLDACNKNPCGSPSKGVQYNLSNFEPGNFTNKSFTHAVDTGPTTLNDYSLFLQFEYERVVQNSPFQLIPNAMACPPALISHEENISEIHIYSFGKNHTYLDNLQLDSLFYINDISLDNTDFKQYGARNSFFKLKDEHLISDTLQFRITIKLIDGTILEQANKPIWLVSK